MNTQFSHFRKLGTCAFAVLAFLFASAASAQVWRSARLTGGDVRAFASDPNDSRNVYLGTTDGHIFGSRDGGESWKLLGLAGANSDALVTGLIVDPRNPSQIFASTWTREASGEGGGIFVSHDRGVTWQESGLRAHAVRALAQAASNPDVLVAGALDGVFISRDGARNWKRATPPGDDELRNFDSLAIDPANPEIIYAGTFHLPWKTIDGGQNWSAIHAGMIEDSDVLSLAFDATNSRRILASACSGIYRSDSGGATWQKIAGIPYASRRTLVIRQDPAQPNVWYAGTTEGLWKSSDGGGTWARISPADWVINAMLVQPESGSSATDSVRAQPARLLLGTERQGVIASDDGGAHFRAANDGFYHRRILSVAVDGRDARRIAAVLANAPNSVVLSNDGGTSWTAMDGGLAPDSVRSVFSFPSGWWATVSSGGLIRYDDARRAWLRTGTFWEIPASLGAAGTADSSRRSVRPIVNDVYVSEAGWFAATEQGLFVSRDEGKNWISLRFAPTDLPVQSVLASPDGKSIRIVSSNGMVFSDDAGHSWTWHDLPMDSRGALKLEGADESTLLAEARTGLYISRDGGATWTTGHSGLPGSRAQDLLLRPGLWLVSTQSEGNSGGLYASTDEGKSWFRVKTADGNQRDGLGGGEFPVLAATGAPEEVFAGSASEGLYLLEFDRVLNAGEGRAVQTRVPAGGGH
jgi:photosystem II stability/assembly factor-like uncharacterized protein